MSTVESKDIALYERLGFNLLLDRRSLVDESLISAGWYEPKQMEYFTNIAEHFRGKPNTVFLDIGSYFGIYSLLFRRTGIFSTMYAFEADAHNFSQLQSNLFLNMATHEILGRNLAVSDQDGIVFMRDSTKHEDGNRGGTHRVAENSEYAKFEVQSIKLDTYLNLRDAHIAMKLDIEGHEPAALRGLTRTLHENKVLMQIEIFDQQKPEVFPLLEELGMRQIHGLYPDFYYTNISKEELGV